MRTVAVVIPYFQREAGILERALRSICEQDVEDALVTVLVVDDASPHDPARDIEVLKSQVPAHCDLQILRRENGGPGAARNTGFESAARIADFVALLDSDDFWRPCHLRNALASFEAGADLYFSDHLDMHGAPHLPATSFHGAMTEAGSNETLASQSPCMLPGRRMAELAAREYLAHTSSIVYRASALGQVRMSETLRAAGEDHLFFVDLALASNKVAVSPAVEVELGRGVNLYAGAFDWGSERDLRRRTFNLGALKMMCSRSCWPDDLRRHFVMRRSAMRRTIGFLLIRRLLAQGRLPIDAMKLLWRFDKTAVLLSPLSALSFAARRTLLGEKSLSVLE